MQINRLFEMVYILLSKKTITAKELAEYFEVSQRTIYRDIETLSQAGIPIYTSKGKGGGISLLDNFVLNKSLLSQEEQNEILSALQGLNATQYPDNKNILNRLSTLFDLSIANWIEVDFSDWGSLQKDNFMQLKESILSQRCVVFDYYNREGLSKQRLVEPYQLWFKGKSWYLRGLCRKRKDLRVFKLTRIKELNILEETFEKNLIEDFKDFPNQVIKEHLVTLKLQIDSSQSYRVYDEFNEEQIKKDEEGHFIITATYPEDEWVYGYILSFGCFAKVLEPIHIQEIIKERMKKILAMYI